MNLMRQLSVYSKTVKSSHKCPWLCYETGRMKRISKQNKKSRRSREMLKFISYFIAFVKVLHSNRRLSWLWTWNFSLKGNQKHHCWSLVVLGKIICQAKAHQSVMSTPLWLEQTLSEWGIWTGTSLSQPREFWNTFSKEEVADSHKPITNPSRIGEILIPRLQLWSPAGCI